MKVSAIIQARMGSSRLRGKSLTPVAGLPLLYRVTKSVKELTFIDEIIIATTDLPEDDLIELSALNWGVKVYRGSSFNLLERFYNASLHLAEKDTIVRFTADNPLNNSKANVEAFEIHKNGNYDYTHIDGLSHIVAEFIKVRAIREVFKNYNPNHFDKEHVTPFFRKRKDLFKVKTLPSDFYSLRPDLDPYLTVDEIEELRRMETLIYENETDTKGTDFEKIYKWLDSKIYNEVKKNGKATIKLAGTPVGEEFPTYIVAEIGQNHNGSVEIARKLISNAVRCGANAVKFQKRDIKCELTREAYNKPYDNPNSFGETYGKHREFLELNEEQHLELKEYANSLDITYFCTPCDEPSVELMERIGCPFYKVASRDLTNTPLLEKLAETNKTVIISTGMADEEDINDALFALNADKEKTAILKCTSEYPTKLENVNLRGIKTLKDKYGLVTGLSDHTSGIVISVAASVMGASIIEKHITLDRTMKGTDHPGALEEYGLYKLIDYIRAVERAMGNGEIEVSSAIKPAKLKLARSITSKNFIRKGEAISENLITLKSPGDGLKWKEKEMIIGRRALRDIDEDTTLRLEYFEE